MKLKKSNNKTDSKPQPIITPIEIRTMEANDMERVLKIYQQAIDTQLATFEDNCSLEIWEKLHHKSSRFVMLNEAEEIIGWCGLLKVSERICYKGVAETSIYLNEEYQGKGLGGVLLEKLITDSEEQGFWTLQTHLFPENEKAIRVHQKLGFRLVGTMEKIGNIKGIWKDVVLYERRKKD